MISAVTLLLQLLIVNRATNTSVKTPCRNRLSARHRHANSSSSGKRNTALHSVYLPITRRKQTYQRQPGKKNASASQMQRQNPVTAWYALTILIPEFPALINCEHDAEICGGCYKGWIASELDSKSWKETGCPGSDCKQLLEYAEVQ